jgi:rhodanese-related sulfurtransferase
VTKILYRVSLLTLIIVLAPFGHFLADGWAMNKKAYENIYIDQFVKMMDQKDFILINVHVPYYGEISQTDLLVPFNAIEQYKNDLPREKNAKIVVYCMMGPMGDIAAEKLASMGYTRVSNFQGGMMAWTQAGKHLQRRQK